MSARGRLTSSALPDAPGGPASSRAVSKGDYVYAEIKEAILAGRLPPGSPIDKAALCERLGVSRFPVVSAIHRLSFEGLVTVAPQHGSFVVRLALSEVLECMMLRTAIESETAALAAERRPDGLVDLLDRSLQQQAEAETAGDGAAFYALDLGFHALMLSSLGLQRTATTLDGLRTRLERIRRILSAPEDRMARTRADHAAIRDAVAAGAPAAARNAMRRHLESTAALFRGFADLNPTLFSDLP